jgi:hypothetical protein
LGVAVSQNRLQFIGHLKNGKFHGSGKLVADDGQIIREGQWADGNFKEE